MTLDATLLRGATTPNLLRLARWMRVDVGQPWSDAGRAALIVRILREAQLRAIADRMMKGRAA